MVVFQLTVLKTSTRYVLSYMSELWVNAGGCISVDGPLDKCSIRVVVYE